MHINLLIGNTFYKQCFVCLFQIFVGKIPRDLFEDELVPLFEKAGPIWDLRLMMDPLTGLNRGYAFVTFCTKEAAQEAVKLVSFLGFFFLFDEIRSGLEAVVLLLLVLKCLM